jgi:hypothetical protein
MKEISKYKITFKKSYLVNGHSDQEAKESAMIVWEKKNHPVNISVQEIKETKEKKHNGNREKNH